MSGRRNFFKVLGTFLSGSFLGRANAASPSSTGAVQPSSDSLDRPRASAASGPGGVWQQKFDLVVVGGGIAGVSAAISAARNGMHVALVHNRSMLGGNSSSEVKLFPENNSGHQPWIKEGGIHEEFHTEERVRNHLPYLEGTMNCHWDLVLYEKVFFERNLTLFLNTHVFRANMETSGRIRSVRALQIGTEKTFVFSAPLFVDCTGDGFLAHLAGAEYRWGREARVEYRETLAPEESDGKVMGNTLFFRAVDTGHPVPFKKPDWAATFEREEDLPSRGHQNFEGGYWWIEVGAPHHPIADNEQIRHEGLRQLLGVWDHIKNRGDHGAENYGLEFVGFWPYKRECRRILGDYVLTQHHVQSPELLEDAVAYGCWGIDIHVQGGILNRTEAPYPPPNSDANWDRLGASVYGIPLRALYSRTIENLMMAGRPISGSYVAFASTRVLSTGSIVGQAVGAAASVCKKHSKGPREVAREHVHEVQQILLRQDCHIPGIENSDPDDLARKARVTASSEAVLVFPEPNRSCDLRFPHAQLVPVSGDRLDRVDILLESKRSEDIRLRLGLRPAASVWDFRSREEGGEAFAIVRPGKAEWVPFELGAKVEPGRLYYVYTEALPGLHWKAWQDQNGEPSLCPVGTTPANQPGSGRWRPLTQSWALCLRLYPESRPYGPANVTTGTNRPDKWSNIWVSDPQAGFPAWLELSWESVQEFNQVQITFDTNANRRETAPLFRYPECAKDYTLEAFLGGSWKQVASVEGNYYRRRLHEFDRIQTDRLRLMIHVSNGAPSARVYEVRVYNRV